MDDFKLDENGWFGIAAEEWIDSKSTCLLIIDMQNYDASRDWAIIGTSGTGTPASSTEYYYTRIEAVVVPAIRKVLTYFREHNLMVIHSLFASRFVSAPDMPRLWKYRFQQHAEDSGKQFDPYEKNEEMQIIPPLAPLPGEPVLTKVTGSAFLSTPLDRILRRDGITSLIVCGAWGNSCVEDTVRSGCDLGYLLTYMEDGIVSPDEEFHIASVRVLGEMYCQVRSSDWIIKALEKGRLSYG
jgi:nicotinamidase-related amidase